MTQGMATMLSIEYLFNIRCIQKVELLYTKRMQRFLWQMGSITLVEKTMEHLTTVCGELDRD